MSLILSGNSGSLTVDSTAGITFPNGTNPQAAIAAKASVLAKLTALGLTQAEVTALIG